MCIYVQNVFSTENYIARIVEMIDMTMHDFAGCFMFSLILIFIYLDFNGIIILPWYNNL